MRETIKKISKYLKANEKILLAYLYGSMAWRDMELDEELIQLRIDIIERD